MEIRPGDEGPYLLLTAGGTRLVLQDKDDPRVYGGLFTLCYDEGAEALSVPAAAESASLLQKTRRRGGMPRLGRGLYPPRLDGFTDRFCIGRG